MQSHEGYVEDRLEVDVSYYVANFCFHLFCVHSSEMTIQLLEMKTRGKLTGRNLVLDADRIRSSQSLTTSLATSIMNYRVENGRTYHQYKDGRKSQMEY
jgi:hypothetical protein